MFAVFCLVFSFVVLLFAEGIAFTIMLLLSAIVFSFLISFAVVQSIVFVAEGALGEDGCNGRVLLRVWGVLCLWGLVPFLFPALFDLGGTPLWPLLLYMVLGYALYCVVLWLLIPVGPIRWIVQGGPLFVLKIRSGDN
jgi:hypothetical protein